MSASLARRRRAARLAGAAVVGLTPALASSGARAQYAAGGGVPLGLPPAAVILNSPVGGMPNTLGQPGDLRYMPAVPAAERARRARLVDRPLDQLAGAVQQQHLPEFEQSEGDFITAVTPSIQVTGATPRVTANLIYAPTFELYAEDPLGRCHRPAGHRLDHRGTGARHLVRDGARARLGAAVRRRARRAQRARAASARLPARQQFRPAAPPGAVALDKNNRSQNFGASITPYVVHRFGDFGTAKAGVTLTE